MIYGPNGKQALSIPVIKVNGNHTMVKDVQLDNSSRWQQIHWRSVETAYNNSPFFLYYKDLFEPFFRKRFESILEFNTRILEVLLHIFQTDTIIGYTNSYEKNPLGVTDQRSSWIGKDQQNNFPPYIQCFSGKFGFLSDLSILDLIFNLGPEGNTYLKTQIKV
jgi:hypothetical protein